MKHRAQAERMLLEKVRRGEWVSALEMAGRLGWPWRVVARAMQRMGARGELEAKIEEWKSKRSRVRRTTKYRKPVASTAPPSWLAPRPAPVVGARPVVFGAAPEGGQQGPEGEGEED